MSQRVAIEHPADDDFVTGFGAFRVLEPFGAAATDDILDSVRKRVGRAMRDFPALAHETVNVGVLYENADAQAQAFGYNRLICLPPTKPTTNVTLWHELGHVAIRVRHEDGEDVSKTSEEFCSIYSVARMAPEVIDEDRIPYLGQPSAPREEWPTLCRQALQYREENGANSHYIKRCKELLGVEQ